MSLITCPECGKQVSDRANICIHCGFPIAYENQPTQVLAGRQFVSDEKNESGDKDRNITTYLSAGADCMKRKDYPQALQYYKKAYDIDAGYKKGLAAYKIGFLYSLPDSSVFNAEQAIYYLSKSRKTEAYRRKAKLFNPYSHNDGFEKHKDSDMAIKYYKKALSTGNKNKGIIYNDLGVLYGENKNNSILAACYCFLGLRELPDDTAIKTRYNTYIKKLSDRDGNIWKENIECITTPKDIEPVINKVNREINNRKKAAPKPQLSYEQSSSSQKTSATTSFGNTQKKESSGSGCAIVFLIIAMFFLLATCGGGDDYDAHDLRASQERYYSGSYTREDERMVEGFNRWKADQNKYID